DANDSGHGGDELGEALVQRLADRVDIVCDARKDIAVCGAVIILEGQAADLLVNFLPQVVSDLHGNAGDDIALGVGKPQGNTIENDQERAHTADVGKIHVQRSAIIVGDQSLGELGRYVAQQLWADNRENGRQSGKDDHNHDLDAIGIQIVQERA